MISHHSFNSKKKFQSASYITTVFVSEKCNIHVYKCKELYTHLVQHFQFINNYSILFMNSHQDVRQEDTASVHDKTE